MVAVLSVIYIAAEIVIATLSSYVTNRQHIYIYTNDINLYTQLDRAPFQDTEMKLNILRISYSNDYIAKEIY